MVKWTKLTISKFTTFDKIAKIDRIVKIRKLPNVKSRRKLLVRSFPNVRIDDIDKFEKAT